MDLANLISCLYISWIADVIVNLILRIFKSQFTKHVEDSEKSEGQEKEMLDESSAEKEPSTVKETKCENATKDKSKIVSSLTNIFGKSKKSKSPVFGKKIDLSEIQQERPKWQEDPFVKDGLSRVDKYINEGKTKITSYYDDSGKLIYQKEKDILSSPPLPLKEILSMESGDKHFKPTFHIKPQTEEQPKKESNNKFDKIMEDVKSRIDKDIDKTYKEVYEDVLPSVF